MIGQHDDEAAFIQVLDQAGVHFSKPLESFFKAARVYDNDLLNYQYAWRSKAHPVEIRYHVRPISENSPKASAPQVLITSMIMNLASNDDGQSDMVFHRLPDSWIDTYNADLGITVFFRPKAEFSGSKHCKAIIYYAYGKGLITTFLLFDKTDIDLSIYDDALSFIDN